MTSYLEKLRSLRSEKQAPSQTDKTDKTGFEGFVGEQGRHFSKNEALLSVTTGADFSEKHTIPNRQNRQNPPAVTMSSDRRDSARDRRGTVGQGRPYARTLAALEARCPDHIEPGRWQRAVEDGRRFLGTWGEQAHAFGWTARDLFGLHKPPTAPHPSYDRLSRYDATGLVWLLDGHSVTALSSETAAIRWPSGSITRYRKSSKPALGPLGDSLDDFQTIA
jgi:hypothetical protein